MILSQFRPRKYYNSINLIILDRKSLQEHSILKCRKMRIMQRWPYYSLAFETIIKFRSTLYFLVFKRISRYNLFRLGEIASLIIVKDRLLLYGDGIVNVISRLSIDRPLLDKRTLLYR